MTVETRTTMQLSDIKAIEFECTHCHAKRIFQIRNFDTPPLNCGSCGESQPWFVANSPDRSDI
jgi:DNA replicative helicase MCM subunit Mcm2 (Cdc46/Mcm family)